MSTGSMEEEEPRAESSEARKGLRHIGAAGMDNLPSVLSGFTPVLTVTPERRIAKRPRIYYGEGKERRGTKHLWKGIRPVCGLGESHPQAAELGGTWHISGAYKTVQQRCWE